MTDTITMNDIHLARQIRHWSSAIDRLGDFDFLASAQAWGSLEKYLGVTIRKSLMDSIRQLRNEISVIEFRSKSVTEEDKRQDLLNKLSAFRMQYLRTETALDFYGDAVNTRTSSRVAGLLTACDIMAGKAMAQILSPLGRDSPPVLTYVDKGLGASILKAGLRLWDGSTLSPVAAIKVARHNLLRPTAIIHEAGHQIAHILDWNSELAETLRKGLKSDSEDVAEMWASWASEVAADAIAFAYTGYASIAALHDLLSGDESFVFRYRVGDPHPISYIRVLLGTQMCSDFFGPGPWDSLSARWIRLYPLSSAPSQIKVLMEFSSGILKKIVQLCFLTPMEAFQGKSLVNLVNPSNVSPQALNRLERLTGASLYTSNHWLITETIRLLGLSGLKVALLPEKMNELLKRQEIWMVRMSEVSSKFR